MQRKGLRAERALERVEALAPQPFALAKGALALVAPPVVPLHLGRRPTLGVVVRVRELRSLNASSQCLPETGILLPTKVIRSL